MRSRESSSATSAAAPTTRNELVGLLAESRSYSAAEESADDGAITDDHRSGSVKEPSPWNSFLEKHTEESIDCRTCRRASVLIVSRS